MDHKQKMALADKLANLEGEPNNTCRAIVDEVITKCGMVKQMHEGLTRLFPSENFDYILQ